MSTRGTVRGGLIVLALAGGALAASPALASPPPPNWQGGAASGPQNVRPQNANPQNANPQSGPAPVKYGYDTGVLPTASRALAIASVPRLRSLACVDWVCA
ncbi:hypothetical protein FHR83_003703 [Actinoplanes campanulatus]|uniref:Uncharacterized protein n=1 Tax=Actinoplanes campanulatus TaxID=113559 RepID=A0A7W5AGZ7_9ACTN|nr:hypothetical protein [Actinoplanes campanulatus]MBB3096033.1 hypothetical protein [Actinoplanes campanulatus]GGN13233.1 hypothetical protein GCM10010109_24170 [Actinoplanes campanulatus]GID36873.1 hypothetical protein Aca09nite_33790 [Actinoplanes campanulatus]